MTLSTEIQAILNSTPIQILQLYGGMIGKVYRVTLSDKTQIVAKVAQDKLDIEGYMLRYLKDNSALPVPDVLHSSPSLLLMTFIDGDSHISNDVQHHAAELLATLHSIKAKQFGLERDTLIGGLHQPNQWTHSWVTFFREQRLLHMAHNSPLPPKMLERIEKLADKLEDFLEEPEHPALLHGDMWTTNILAKNGRVTGLVDPAIYYGHPEIELAFSTLFNTFGTAFFREYNAIKPIAPGFMEVRRDLYNLYPLLVHVRLFGGSYVYSVDSILTKLGF